MGTSLIGKAVDFGSKEYGFESRVSKVSLLSDSLLLNNVNLSLGKKRFLNSRVSFSKRNLLLIKFLKSLGVVVDYRLVFQKNRKFIVYSVFFYKNSNFFHRIRCVSTSSKKFYITYRALCIASSYLNSTTIILSTSRGLMTHFQALKFKIGGLILFGLY